MTWWAIHRRQTFSLIAQRFGAVAIMLLAYLVATIGYPQWHIVTPKVSKQPFPCQASACGCRTAEQCRSNCCCHTTKEKVAWALEHGVDPSQVSDEPAELLVQYVAEIRSGQVCAANGKKGCCCTKKVAVAPAPTPAPKSCCGTVPTPASTKLTFVLGIQARKCQGSDIDWIQAGFVALPPAKLAALKFPDLVEPARPVPVEQYLAPPLGHLLRPA